MTCPGTTLAAGASMTCTAGGTAVAGQYANHGLAVADDPTLGADLRLRSQPLLRPGSGARLRRRGRPDLPHAASPRTARGTCWARTVYLGACVDSEIDGQPTAGADGDDLGAGVSTFGTCARGRRRRGRRDLHHPARSPRRRRASTWSPTRTAPSPPGSTSTATATGSTPGEDLFPGGTALTRGNQFPDLPRAGLPRARAPPPPASAAPPREPCAFTGEAPDGEVEDYAVTVARHPAVSLATKSVDAPGGSEQQRPGEPGRHARSTPSSCNNNGAATATASSSPTPRTPTRPWSTAR